MKRWQAFSPLPDQGNLVNFILQQLYVGEGWIFLFRQLTLGLREQVFSNFKNYRQTEYA